MTEPVLVVPDSVDRINMDIHPVMQTLLAGIVTYSDIAPSSEKMTKMNVWWKVKGRKQEKVYLCGFYMTKESILVKQDKKECVYQVPVFDVRYMTKRGKFGMTSDSNSTVALLNPQELYDLKNDIVQRYEILGTPVVQTIQASHSPKATGSPPRKLIKTVEPEDILTNEADLPPRVLLYRYLKGEIDKELAAAEKDLQKAEEEEKQKSNVLSILMNQ